MKSTYIYFSALLLLILIPETSAAQQSLVGGICEGSSCSACHFIELGNRLIIWLIGVITVLFGVLMAVAGFQLLTAGGNQSALQSAKEKFVNGLVGFLIVLAAWLLIDTLMRALLPGNTGTITGYGPWAQVQCWSQVQPTVIAGTVGSVTIGPNGLPACQGTTGQCDTSLIDTGGVTSAAGTCSGTTCQPLTIPCVARGTTGVAGDGCNISADMVSRLSAFHSQAAVSGARVTEAMPPSRPHQSPCHTNGTCVDYSKAGGMTGAEVASAVAAARANNLRPVYEVGSTAERDLLIQQGAPANAIVVLPPRNGVPQITAPHFSIYGY